MQQKSAYEKNVVLPPGNYKIDLVVRDVNSGKTVVSSRASPFRSTKKTNFRPRP